MEWYTHTPVHARMNLYALCTQISQWVNYTTQMLQYLVLCNLKVSLLLWCEGLGCRLKGGIDHEVCGQFIFTLGESNSTLHAHNSHAINMLSAWSLWTVWPLIGLEFHGLLSIKFKWIWLEVWTDANWFSKHWVTISVPVLPIERCTQFNLCSWLAWVAIHPLPCWAGIQIAGFQELGGPSAGHAQVLISKLPGLFVQAAYHSLLDTCVQITLSGQSAEWVCVGVMKCRQAAGGRSLMGGTLTAR